MADSFKPGDEPLHALEYEVPRPPSSQLKTWIGAMGGLFFSVGVGSITFGILMSWGYRDDYAGPISIGAGFVTLGAIIFYLAILRK